MLDYTPRGFYPFGCLVKTWMGLSSLTKKTSSEKQTQRQVRDSAQGRLDGALGMPERRGEEAEQSCDLRQKSC